MLGFIDVRDVKQKRRPIETLQQYIHSFIRRIKQILRNVSDLYDVRIHIHAFDPLNEIHQWITTVVDLLKDLIKLPIDYKRSIFMCIRKKGRVLFLGHMQF